MRLIGFVKRCPGPTGWAPLISVVNLKAPIRRSAPGVTVPWKMASMLSGREGLWVADAVALAAGGAVSEKNVAVLDGGNHTVGTVSAVGGAVSVMVAEGGRAAGIPLGRWPAASKAMLSIASSVPAAKATCAFLTSPCRRRKFARRRLACTARSPTK